MYKIASQNNQRRKERLIPSRLPSLEREPSPKELRENLVKKFKQLTKQICSLPRNSVERRRLGIEQFEVGKQINALRPKLKGNKEMLQHFIDIVRETMPKAQFDRLMRQAFDRVNPRPAAGKGDE